jgi:hypothetical protein
MSLHVCTIGARLPSVEHRHDLRAHRVVAGRMRSALPSRNPSQRDPIQPLLVKYLYPLGLGSDDPLGAEGAEFAIDNLARSAGCVGESLLSDVRNRESIMGGKGDRSEVEGDTRCRR